ncbi:hypothetical protein DFP72DRAFT_865393 [Ephemerocybe angulata]|uniref:GRAM domain-containing protein n=1 Tax=Ephemerocybe angulata TaxID=980116 RepID=A0A8H6IIA5_9AGAR|nr:hypothetical protein DFP72DRAFT_865393 [Tulosesus angulatus]
MEPPNTDPPAADAELSEAQLREQYENAEIQRFLHIFSTYVTEVKSADALEASQNVTSGTVNTELSIGDTESASMGQSDGKAVPAALCPSEHLARYYISPILPLQQHEIAPFTLARVRLTVNRLYIIAQIHVPHLKAVADLAQWADFKSSFLGCAAFWILWWYNALLPCLFLGLLVGVLHRGLFPYPSVQDLRTHHARITQADEFSDSLSTKISPTSTLDIKEVWRLYRLARTDWKKKFKSTKKPSEVKAEEFGARPKDDSESLAESEETEPVEDATILDDPNETKESKELRRVILHAFTEIADFHERMRNIAIWRNPAASKRYSAALFMLFLVTSLVPARYLAKGAYLALGIIFWHVIPIACALSPEDRSRIPPPLADVPTDAEYAMKLISERVAKGQDVQALFRPKQVQKDRPGKLRGLGKLIGEEGSRVAHMTSPSIAAHPLFSGAMAILAPDAHTDLHTYPAQRGTHPGLITLTMKRFLFTPFVTSSSKVDIDIKAITGVKKNGVLRGLQVSYLDPATQSEVEERFLWISGRDELFTRLIGLGKRSWKNI